MRIDILSIYKEYSDDMIYYDIDCNKTTLKELSDEQIKKELIHYKKIDNVWNNTYVFILNDVLIKRRMNKLKKLL